MYRHSRTTDSLAERILYLDSDIADQSDIVSLFGTQDQLPGTFAIAERRTCPSFLSESERTLGYRRWIEQVIRRDIALLRQFLGVDAFDDWETANLVNEAIALLDLPLPDGRMLCEAVPNQIYSDVVRRVLMYLLFADPSHIVHTFRDLNQIGLDLALQLIREEAQLEPENAMKRAILAGLIGLDQKDTASATSHIVRTRVIPMGTIDSLRPIEEIREDLNLRVTSEEWGISCWQDFVLEILERRRSTTVAWLTDDYIETVLDLDTVKSILREYPHISIWLIPRLSQYGNDASYSDVMHMLTLPEFSLLQSCERFRVCDDGPRLGTVDPRAISPRMAEWLLRADYLVVKGARAYEMMQGIRKPVYFGFTVCREISETVTGLDSSLGLPVFIRQAPGEHSFQDFRSSAVRRITFASGRVVGLAATTACEYVGRKRCRCHDALADVAA